MLEEQAAQEEQVSDTLPESDAPEVSEGEYFLSEGVKGNGEAPDWYNSTKYKSVADQAKAYNELEKKFGGFKGAPKDGYAAPEGVDAEDALFTELQSFAKDTNMSQDTLNRAWELLTVNEQAQQEAEAEYQMQQLGENADKRIKNVEGFLRNNLSADDFNQVSELITTADNVKIIEMIVNATAPAKLPVDGGEMPTGVTWADIEAEMYKKDDYGNFLRSTDINHDKKVKKMLQAFEASTQ